MEDIFAQFLKDKTYIRNVTPQIISFYKQSFNAFRRAYKGELTALSKADLNGFVVALRERGMSPNGANVYIRGMNSFFSWCHENGLTAGKLAAPKLEHFQRYQLPTHHSYGLSTAPSLYLQPPLLCHTSHQGNDSVSLYLFLQTAYKIFNF